MSRILSKSFHMYIPWGLYAKDLSNTLYTISIDVYLHKLRTWYTNTPMYSKGLCSILPIKGSECHLMMSWLIRAIIVHIKSHMQKTIMCLYTIRVFEMWFNNHTYKTTFQKTSWLEKSIQPKNLGCQVVLMPMNF